MKYLVKIGNRSYITSGADCALKLAKRSNGNIKMLNGEQEKMANKVALRHKNNA